MEDVEKELEHSSIQEQLDRELKELDKRLEEKEVNVLRSTFMYSFLLDIHYTLTHFFSLRLR